MSLKITCLLVISLLAAVHNVHCQELDSWFMVYLGQYTSSLNTTVIKCVGTLISQLHILCTASCVMVEPPTRIAIDVKALPDVSAVLSADRVLIHPFYERNQNAYNAAIVMTLIFRSNPNFRFVPRSLGRLSTFSSCNLFGWGGESLDPRRDVVMVNSSALCDPNNPQNFCTIFESASHSTCSALQASPLTCGNDRILAGFVTNEEGCITNGGRTMLNYHSLDHFRDWIESVFAPGPELPVRDTVNFIVTVMERNVIAVPRCFGTIISSNRVLTTATCATIDPSSPIQLEVETRIVQGSIAWSSDIEASRIYIHPYYNDENPFENNVAVLQINGAFNRAIVPRTVGSIHQNNSCQLFGWGPSDIGFTRGDAVTVNEPRSCDPYNAQAFCSSHPTIFHYSCTAMTGSPVTCGGNESVIAGFLINNATCRSNDNRVSLSYHSVSEFADWIRDPTNERNAAVNAKVSIGFVVLLVFLSGSIKQ